MATFTMRLSEVIDTIYGDIGEDYEIPYEEHSFAGVTYGKLPTLPEPEKIGLGTYPIFDEGYRNILNGKIIDEYFNREIGSETIDEFKLIMRRTMDQIMPYYNKLYESEQIPYEALATMQIDSTSHAVMTGAENVTAENSSDATTKSSARAVNSSTPQTLLAGNEDYATSAADSNSTSDADSIGTSVSESDSNSENVSESHVTGYQGIASDLIMRYRGSLLNIDTLIISDLQNCFMLILNNGDAYTQASYPRSLFFY